MRPPRGVAFRAIQWILRRDPLLIRTFLVRLLCPRILWAWLSIRAVSGSNAMQAVVFESTLRWILKLMRMFGICIGNARVTKGGQPSHDGCWEDAPRGIRDCALRNGFNGADAVESDQYFESSEPSKWLYPVIFFGAAFYVLLSEITP